MIPKTYRKKGHPQNSLQGQEWEETNTNDTLNIFDNAETRTPTLIVEGAKMNNKKNKAVVRRLTPLECVRLQGFPEREENGKIVSWVDIGEWTDEKGKVHKDADSPKYKALGNSIGLPFWQWLADKIVGQLKKDGVDKPTMASLFDGIGGFPLVFKRAGCEPLWNSEIESFPEAVTTKHFGDEDKGIEGDLEKFL